MKSRRRWKVSISIEVEKVNESLGMSSVISFRHSHQSDHENNDWLNEAQRDSNRYIILITVVSASEFKAFRVVMWVSGFRLNSQVASLEWKTNQRSCLWKLESQRKLAFFHVLITTLTFAPSHCSDEYIPVCSRQPPFERRLVWMEKNLKCWFVWFSINRKRFQFHF